MKKVWSDVKFEELDVNMTLGGGTEGASEKSQESLWGVVRDPDTGKVMKGQEFLPDFDDPYWNCPLNS